MKSLRLDGEYRAPYEVIDAEYVGRALDGRKSGQNWICQCPAHTDKSPSFSIRDGRNGKLLVNCFAGCTFKELSNALREKGLWPSCTEEQKQSWLKEKRSKEYNRHRLIANMALSDLDAGKPISVPDQDVVNQSIHYLRRFHGQGR